MNLSKKRRPKNNSDFQVYSQKCTIRAQESFPLKKRRPSSLKSHLSQSLSNSLKRLAPGISSKSKPVSLLSPTTLIGHSSHPKLSSSSSKKLQIKSKPSFSSIKGADLTNVTPKMALTYFKSELTDYEKIEITEYKSVYYIGRLKDKITPNPIGVNYGFDDDRGDYLLIAGDQIAYRYETLSLLGKGNFGQVVLCLDHKSNQKVALKVIRNKKRFNSQAKVEIKVLQTMQDDAGSKYVVRMKNYFVFRNHICIAFERLDVNLFELLQMSNFEGFSLSLIRRFVYQILRCLSIAYKNRVIHCDLKPENIMLVAPKKAHIRVIDFGSSCFEPERLFTYVQSRFYRAPEIILGIPYTTAIDMWSLGCIIVEFVNGFPIFAGESEHDQLVSIMEVLGLPPIHVLKAGAKTRMFFEVDWQPKLNVAGKEKKKIPGSKKITEFLIGVPETMVDLVNRCFDWDPTTRITPDEALNHPWLREKHKKSLNKP